jgi:hypothetical protein
MRVTVTHLVLIFMLRRFEATTGRGAQHTFAETRDAIRRRRSGVSAVADSHSTSPDPRLFDARINSRMPSSWRLPQADYMRMRLRIIYVS